MSLIADGLLNATCLTAAIYCYVLARRLKQFSSTEAGIGQQILQLSATLEETRGALKEAQASAKADAAGLERNIADARKLATQLRNLIEQGTVVAAATSKPTPEVEAMSRPGGQGLAPAAGGLTAAAAVEVQDTPPAEPLADVEPEEIDPAEINVADLLAASTGEQQLGFLPDDSEEEGEDRLGANASDGSEDAADYTADEMLDNGADKEPEYLPQDGSKNLLKVERMAL